MKNEKQKNTYYVGYRGYVTVVTTIEASSEEEAFEMARDMSSEPTEDMKLKLINSDFGFEIDSDYIYSGSDIKKVPKKLNKQIVISAHNQAFVRKEAMKKHLVEKVSKELSDANCQLVATTEGISLKICELKKQLAELESKD